TRHDLPAFPLVQAGGLACYRRQGFWFGDADPETAVRDARVPILFFHGGADDFVPPSMAEALYEAAPGNPSPRGSAAYDKTLLIIPDASHCRAIDARPAAYWMLLDPFLELRLGLNP
ncbi:MAG: alpha/beta hydrolase, partial [Oscillospiraceae bacterium]|nr:alpha/beta hydrolase [Oscillospiraceae bacterium]